MTTDPSVGKEEVHVRRQIRPLQIFIDFDVFVVVEIVQPAALFGQFPFVVESRYLVVSILVPVPLDVLDLGPHVAVDKPELRLAVQDQLVQRDCHAAAAAAQVDDLGGVLGDEGQHVRDVGHGQLVDHPVAAHMMGELRANILVDDQGKIFQFPPPLMPASCHGHAG